MITARPVLVSATASCVNQNAYVNFFFVYIYIYIYFFLTRSSNSDYTNTAAVFSRPPKASSYV